MAGVARLRTMRPRRQGPNWLRVLVIAVLAAVGGAVLWNGVQYSAAHDNSAASLRRATQQEVDAAAALGGLDGGSGSSDGTDMSAWAHLTGLPAATGGDGGDAGGGGDDAGGSGGGDAGGGAGAGQGRRPGDDGSGFKEGEKFLTVALRVPKMPPTFNSWVQTEDMLLFHLRALQTQLEQVYVGAALAAATGRALVLPEFTCFCQNSDAPLPRCRRPDAGALQFPAACREGDVLVPPAEFAAGGAARGTPLDVRPAALLPALEAAKGEGAVLVVRPSAQVLYPKCLEQPPSPDAQHANPEACVRRSSRAGEQGGGVLLVPPSLNDSALAPLLAPLQAARLWRLDFSDVGSHWHAFQGWDCAEPAHQFDLRLRGVVKPWPAAAPAGSGGGAKARLAMTAGRTYSDEPDMKQDCGGGGGGGGTAAGGAAAAAR